MERFHSNGHNAGFHPDSKVADSTQDCITHTAYQKKKKKGENGLTSFQFRWVTVCTWFLSQIKPFCMDRLNVLTINDGKCFWKMRCYTLVSRKPYHKRFCCCCCCCCFFYYYCYHYYYYFIIINFLIVVYLQNICYSYNLLKLKEGI